ncbi:MAG: metallophosphoesterase family protein [Chloroflexi bacterium]|nr:metallophosphoesterase family protein [Chloroflexota bacterium]
MRLAILSDIHSNLTALDVLAPDIARADRVVCLGDVTGYYCQPNAAIDRMRELDALCVLGNHDHFALVGCPSGAPEAVQWGVAFAQSHLSPENKAWLSRLPLTWEGKIGGIHALLVHGAPWDPLGAYLYADNPRLSELDGYDADLIAFGQTHRALLRDGTRPILLNPGAVGQSRDAIAQACMALVDTDTRAVELIRRPYDPAPVIELARSHGAGDWILKHLV